MNILICEDNVMTLRTMEFALKKAGYTVFKAEDGALAKSMLEEEEINLVLTDINMPYTKGLELIRYINTHIQPKIPVVVITGITNSETKAHAEELGASDYLTKPFDLDEMVARVNSLLGKN